VQTRLPEGAAESTADGAVAALVPEQRSRRYLERLRDGVLELQVCRDCAATQAPPLPLCRRCGSERLERLAARGTGSVVSATSVRHRFLEVSPPVPYVVAIVALDEGPRVFGLMDNDDPQRLVGERVRLRGPFESFGPWFDADVADVE
jgi:uncharacterized OB-fold protein